MNLRHGRQWFLLGWCVVLVWSFSGVARPHTTAAAVPAGLTAADWQAITAQLPHTSTATTPLEQQAYLKASNTGTGDDFGSSVAVSGDTVVVGAPDEDSNAKGINGNQTDNSASNAGAVYVFVRTSNGWSQQAYLKASNTDADDRFGTSVAIDGNTIVVGASGEDSNATGVNGTQTDNSVSNAGAAYVFGFSSSYGLWIPQAYLKASNTDTDDRFGTSVAIDDDTIVVGSPYEDSNATGVNGNQIDNSTPESGAAYVFGLNAQGTWSQQAYLKASNTNTGDYFGNSVAVSGTTVVVGAFGENSNATGINGNQQDNSVNNAGAAYVFVRTNPYNIWIQQAYLKASTTSAFDDFGISVDVSGDTVVVGARGESSNATGVNGNQQDNSAQYSGAAYLFGRTNGVWSQQAYLKASNTDAGDQFGTSVGVSGHTIMVGAPYESSNSTSINGNQTDNSASFAGAAYVFVRSNIFGTWTQQAYLKASNTDKFDFFGSSVAVSGTTIVVGAYSEDSNATGVSGNQIDNSAPDSGAAYIFINPQTVYIPLVQR